jgi:hypothetical protein
MRTATAFGWSVLNGLRCSQRGNLTVEVQVSINPPPAHADMRPADDGPRTEARRSRTSSRQPTATFAHIALVVTLELLTYKLTLPIQVLSPTALLPMLVTLPFGLG